jgi:beta-lactamase class A
MHMNRLLVALLVMVIVSMSAFAADIADRFDVSYLWHRDLTAVVVYRQRVAQVLGPAVAGNLKVVLAGKTYGLIYARAGDHAGAVDVANVHSVLLRARGLEPAAPVRATKWQYVDTRPRVKVTIRSQQAKTQSPVKPAAASAAASKMAPSRAVVAGTLEAAIERHIKLLRRKGRIAADERTGWSVFDFTTGEKLVTINEDTPFQAASLIKPFIAAAYFERVHSGKLKYSARVRQRMERMIRVSDNGATNWITKRVGGPRAVEKLLKRKH